MKILVRRIQRSSRVHVPVGLEHGFEGGSGASNSDVIVVVVVGSVPRSAVVMVAVKPKDSGGFR